MLVNRKAEAKIKAKLISRALRRLRGDSKQYRAVPASPRRGALTVELQQNHVLARLPVVVGSVSCALELDVSACRMRPF